MTTEAEEKKLEARKDRDMGEDPIETTQGEKKSDSNQEIPAWADMEKRLDAMIEKRLDAFLKKHSEEKKEGETRPPEADSKKDASEEAHKAAEELDKIKEKEAKKDAKKDSDEKKKDEGDKDADTDREDRARRDSAAMAENRKLAARLAELEANMGALYREASIEDRNALAATRLRADSLYQALTGQPASATMPGESPIAYRKRTVDGLRKYSDRMKDVKVDALTGEAFAVIEDHIYADAQAAIRSDAIIPAGTLRPIVTEKMGRQKTEYVGDQNVAWEPFMAGSHRVGRLVNPKNH